MANPPTHPITLPLKNNEELPATYFQALLMENAEYLRAIGIRRIEGIEDFSITLAEFQALKPNDNATAWRLAKELSTWSDYFSEISNLIQKHYLDADADKKQLHSELSIGSGVKAVAHGDRIANADAKLMMARKKRNALKALHEELAAKTKFLDKAHAFCKSTYELNKRQETYATTR